MLFFCSGISGHPTVSMFQRKFCSELFLGTRPIAAEDVSPNHVVLPRSTEKPNSNLFRERFSAPAYSR